MPIKLVTDSTCDLPDALAAACGVIVIPLYVNVGDWSYLDGVELTRTAFYAQLPGLQPPPTTAAPGIVVFRTVYERLFEAGATEILSIHIAGGLSATLNNARLAAQELEPAPVTVFDSEQASMALGFLLTTAAEAIAEGWTMAEIIPLLQAQVNRTYLFAALDTMEYLRRSGRANRLVAGLGGLLQIKPLLKLYQGDLTAERVRTGKRAMQRLVELIGEVTPLEKAALLHTAAPDQAKALRRQLESLLPPGDIPIVEATPIFGAHIGPGGVGVVGVAAE